MVFGELIDPGLSLRALEVMQGKFLGQAGQSFDDFFFAEQIDLGLFLGPVGLSRNGPLGGLFFLKGYLASFLASILIRFEFFEPNHLITLGLLQLLLTDSLPHCFQKDIDVGQEIASQEMRKGGLAVCGLDELKGMRVLHNGRMLASYYK